MVSLLTSTSFFDHYSGERYMGMSLTLAFLLGATAFAPRKELTSQVLSAVCFTGLLLDMLINWFVNPNTPQDPSRAEARSFFGKSPARSQSEPHGRNEGKNPRHD